MSGSRNHVWMVLCVGFLAGLTVRDLSWQRAAADPPGNNPNVLADSVAQLQADLAAIASALADVEVDLGDVEDGLSTLQGDVDAVEEKLQNVTVEYGVINGLAGPHVFIEGANVHIRSGGGITADESTGLGNLVIGYNEVVSAGGRGGAHNLVIGPGHTYTSYGGLVAGTSNSITGVSSTVSGGLFNIASGENSNVSSGKLNIADGQHSSITGGTRGSAYGYAASITGGDLNYAEGAYSSISGGGGGYTSGGASSVSGGEYNWALGDFGSVSGGYANQAGDLATVSGGYFNMAQGQYSSVSGGDHRVVNGTYDWRAGNLFEDN